MLILPQYNGIFGYFTAISLYQESRYNDTYIQRSNSTAPLAYRCIGVPLKIIEIPRGILIILLHPCMHNQLFFIFS